MFFSDQDFESIDQEIEAAVKAAHGVAEKAKARRRHVPDLTTEEVAKPQIRLAATKPPVSASVPEIKLYDDELERFAIDGEPAKMEKRRLFGRRSGTQKLAIGPIWLFAVAIWLTAAAVLACIDVKMAICGAGLAAYPVLFVLQWLTANDSKPYRLSSIAMAVQGLAAFRLLHVVVSPLEAFLLVGLLVMFVMTEIVASIIPQRLS